MQVPDETSGLQAGETTLQTVAPRWVFKVMNPIMKALLRSRLHSLMSGSLMLITYTGCKTGKQYTIPIGYFEWEEDELMSFSSARWWTNIRDGRLVTLLIKGKRVEAVPNVIEEREAVIETIETFIQRLGMRVARRLPIGLPSDREPTREELNATPRGFALIHFKIGSVAT